MMNARHARTATPTTREQKFSNKEISEFISVAALIDFEACKIQGLQCTARESPRRNYGRFLRVCTHAIIHQVGQQRSLQRVWS